MTKIRSTNIEAGAIDTAGLQDDIALLGFKVAVAGSVAKYNLVDQTEDSFVDQTGIDSTASTSKAWNSAKYFTGDLSIVQTYAELVGTSAVTASMLTQSGLNSFSAANMIDGGTAAPTYGFYTDSSGVGSWMQIDFGSGNDYSLRRWGYFMGAGGTVYAQWKVQHSDDASTWTDWNSGGIFGGNPAPNNAWQYSGTPANVAGMEHRYWRTYKTNGAASSHFHMEVIFEAYDIGPVGDMVLVSNATTAETAPTKGDIVMTYTNGSGVATLNTDLTAEFSADNGSTWTTAPLVAQGTTGTHLIVSAHNVTRTSTAGTAMRYRIKTFNQSVSKETRIQAVSLGWS
jgi:hypothetical protein